CLLLSVGAVACPCSVRLSTLQQGRDKPQPLREPVLLQCLGHMVGTMDITVEYFYSFFYPERVKRDFEKIRAMGAGSIVYAIHEQEEQRWPRDFERGFRLAQEAGLKVYLSLGRFGNLFAGPLTIPSWYTLRHPQSQVKDRHGTVHEMTCFN